MGKENKGERNHLWKCLITEWYSDSFH